MPRASAWVTLLRTGLSHSLSLEGCGSGLTVNEKRGKARVNISEALGGGRRRQVPLPIDWSPENVDAIRDAALAVYRNLAAGKPIEAVIATLSAQDGEGNNKLSSSDESGPINWQALVEAFRERKLGSGEIKPSTWTNIYARRMKVILAAVDLPRPRFNCWRRSPLHGPCSLDAGAVSCRCSRLQPFFAGA